MVVGAKMFFQTFFECDKLLVSRAVVVCMPCVPYASLCRSCLTCPCVYLVRLICPRALVSSCLTCHTWLTYPTWLACLTYTACVTCPYSLVQSE